MEPVGPSPLPVVGEPICVEVDTVEGAEVEDEEVLVDRNGEVPAVMEDLLKGDSSFGISSIDSSNKS